MAAASKTVRFAGKDPFRLYSGPLQRGKGKQGRTAATSVTYPRTSPETPKSTYLDAIGRNTSSGLEPEASRLEADNYGKNKCPGYHVRLILKWNLSSYLMTDQTTTLIPVAIFLLLRRLSDASPNEIAVLLQNYERMTRLHDRRTALRLWGLYKPPLLRLHKPTFLIGKTMIPNMAE
jgi:hypothetical protein